MHDTRDTFLRSETPRDEPRSWGGSAAVLGTIGPEHEAGSEASVVTTKGDDVFQELDREESLRLLTSVPVGRFVFTAGGLPAIVPVNFVVDRERILFRTREGSKLVAIRAGTVVAFQVDQVEASTGTGWSVTVVGEARILDEPQAARYRDVIRTWAEGVRDEIVAISTPLVTGRRLVNGPAAALRSA